MRLAVLSDIHANLEALAAVRRAGEQCGVERWVCLGDIVGYGADPQACLAQVQEWMACCVMGNHDQAVAGLGNLGYFNAWARQAAEWTAAQLDPAQRRYLAGLPLSLAEGEVLYTHASPADPGGWGYITSAREARAALRATASRLCFVGHSHQPLVCAAGAGLLDLDRPLALRAGERYLVNVGSVGQPRDGNWRACFLVWDQERDTLEFVRSDYHLHRAQAKILEAGLPPFLAQRLAQGY
ncbi:MAG: metallophosphoesterase family protein [Candidatus Latescibacteria bacterium]|nr:metallophosphoesterase family protein [Candidatus Latescibacterota bacterium]